VVARELLGTVLEYTTPAGRVAGRIVETEAYLGPHDPASHSAAGLTPRTRWLFGRPGTAYVYFIYGRYWCFNAVTQPVGVGSAVLVRALEPIDGLARMRRRRPLARRDRDLTNGPGKLCAALGLDGSLNGHLLSRAPLVIRRGDEIPDARVVVTPRIGLTKAAEWPHRYFVRDNPYVSPTPVAFPRVAYG
jgi:DNA-3-methyladenine glycosylase